MLQPPSRQNKIMLWLTKMKNLTPSFAEVAEYRRYLVSPWCHVDVEIHILIKGIMFTWACEIRYTNDIYNAQILKLSTNHSWSFLFLVTTSWSMKVIDAPKLIWCPIPPPAPSGWPLLVVLLQWQPHNPSCVHMTNVHQTLPWETLYPPPKDALNYIITMPLSPAVKPIHITC